MNLLPPKLIRWFRFKQLQRELRKSERLQQRCEAMGLVHLARIEKTYRNEIEEKINRLKAARVSAGAPNR